MVRHQASICLIGSMKSLGLLYKQQNNISLMIFGSEGPGNALVKAFSYGPPILATGIVQVGQATLCQMSDIEH